MDLPFFGTHDYSNDAGTKAHYSYSLSDSYSATDTTQFAARASNGNLDFYMGTIGGLNSSDYGIAFLKFASGAPNAFASCVTSAGAAPVVPAAGMGGVVYLDDINNVAGTLLNIAVEDTSSTEAKVRIYLSDSGGNVLTNCNEDQDGVSGTVVDCDITCVDNSSKLESGPMLYKGSDTASGGGYKPDTIKDFLVCEGDEVSIP